MSLTDAEIAAIEARMNAATPGPWEHGVMYTGMYEGGLAYNAAIAAGRTPTSRYRDGGQWCYLFRSERKGDTSIYQANEGSVVALSSSEYGELTPADAEFIAAARTDIPALLAEVRRLQYELGAERSAG